MEGAVMGTVGKIFLVVAAIAASIAMPYLAPAFAQFLGTSLFVATLIGGLVLTLGLTLLSSVLAPKQKGASVEAGKVNVRLSEPPRWLNGGIAMQGGGALFGEFDSAGNFWYIVVHSDSILTDTIQYYLDGIPVTLDGAGNVITNDFCLNSKKEPYNGSGTRVSYIQIWTTTYTEDDPTPARIAAIDAALPSLWTADHRLVGTTFSVVKMKALKAEDRYKLYKWRGPFGIGEPSVAIAGQWSNMYDPRDPDQVLGDRSTYKPSRNSAIVWAWFRTHPYGRRKAETAINWARVAEQADICDQIVSGIAGTHVRYECGTSIADNKERFTAEQEIIMSCDGQLVFDDDGKTWMRVGYYYTPTITLSRNRDIIAMESVEAQNGESETQGVIVRYIDPSMDYTAQPCAPWYNPLYYKPGEANTFLTVDILTIQDHNQAMRVAKAIGQRSQPAHKIAPTTGLRGLRCRSERIVNLNYDNTFAGDYEIATPIEIDETGVYCGLGLVPIDPDRFNLLPGEERGAPGSYSTETVVVPDAPAGVAVMFNNGRIEATFTDASRADVSYQFQYIKAADLASDQWSDMAVNMDLLFAYSGPIDMHADQLVRWRSVSTSGRVGEWNDPVYTLVGTVDGSLQWAILNSWITEVSEGEIVLSIAADGTLTVENHTRRYPDGHPDVSVTGAVIATGLTTGDARAVAYDDPGRTGGAVTYGLYANDNTARASSTNPGRHYVGYFAVPSTGSSGGGGGGYPGGPCVTADTPVLLASGDRSGPGAQRVAADLRAGLWVWTQHETTMRFGAFQIEAISFVTEPVYKAPGLPRATAQHRFWINGEWRTMETLGVPDGTALVAKITVRDAHTYVSAGVLSHNIKELEPVE
jgi:hypothetical protein